MQLYPAYYGTYDLPTAAAAEEMCRGESSTQIVATSKNRVDRNITIYNDFFLVFNFKFGNIFERVVRSVGLD